MCQVHGLSTVQVINPYLVFVSVMAWCVAQLAIEDASADFVYSKDAWCYMPDKQLIIDQAARIVKPGGKVMFTDWIEGEGLSDEEAQRFLSLMTFPAIPTLQDGVFLEFWCSMIKLHLYRKHFE